MKKIGLSLSRLAFYAVLAMCALVIISLVSETIDYATSPLTTTFNFYVWTEVDPQDKPTIVEVSHLFGLDGRLPKGEKTIQFLNGGKVSHEIKLGGLSQNWFEVHGMLVYDEVRLVAGDQIYQCGFANPNEMHFIFSSDGGYYEEEYKCKLVKDPEL